MDTNFRYRKTIAILPKMMNNQHPPVVNAAANQALDAASAGEAPTAAHVAGKAYKRALLAAKLHDLHLVSTAELGEQIASVVAKALLVGIEGQIPGGVENISGAATTLPAQMQGHHQAQHNQSQAQHNQWQVQFRNIEARGMNSYVTLALMSNDHHIVHLIRRVHDGALPPNFPNNVAELRALNNQDIAELLQFYDLPVNPLATRRERLQQFLGFLS